MITLPEAKLHLRVDSDHEDSVIADMIEAAVQHLASVGIDTAQDPVPAPLKQAALMLIAHFYGSRGLVESEGARLSPAFFRLIAPYREIAL